MIKKSSNIQFQTTWTTDYIFYSAMYDNELYTYIYIYSVFTQPLSPYLSYFICVCTHVHVHVCLYIYVCVCVCVWGGGGGGV